MSKHEAGSDPPDDPVLFQRVGAHCHRHVEPSRRVEHGECRDDESPGECVRAVEADAQLRVAILAGAGEKAFCAGADLKEIVALGGRGDQLFPPGDGFGGFATFGARNRGLPPSAALPGWRIRSHDRVRSRGRGDRREAASRKSNAAALPRAARSIVCPAAFR